MLQKWNGIMNIVQCRVCTRNDDYLKRFFSFNSLGSENNCAQVWNVTKCV